MAILTHTSNSTKELVAFRPPPGLEGICPPPGLEGSRPPTFLQQHRPEPSSQRVLLSASSRAEMTRMLLRVMANMQASETPRELTVCSARKTCVSPSADLASTTDGSTLNSFEPLSETESVSGGEATLLMTTLMVRNIPPSFNQESLQKEWPSDGSYDLLYLPRHQNGQSNLGFAFINFVSEWHAAHFMHTWQGSARLAGVEATKRLNVTYAETQGFEANILLLKKKRVGRTRARQWQPTIMRNGQPVTLEDV